MSRTDSPAKRDRCRVAVWSPTQTYSTYSQQLRAFSGKQAFGLSKLRKLGRRGCAVPSLPPEVTASGFALRVN